jgi:hypothetical protein
MRLGRRASRWFTALAAVALAGCLSVEPAPPELLTTSIGPPPADYETQIRDYFRSSLFDPYSAVYETRKPVRGWGRADDGVMRVFWAVCGTVNAKNRFGGYVGQRPFLAMFNQARIIGGLMDNEPPKYMTSTVVKQCTAWYGAEGSRP